MEWQRSSSSSRRQRNGCGGVQQLQPERKVCSIHLRVHAISGRKQTERQTDRKTEAVRAKGRRKGSDSEGCVAGERVNNKWSKF